MYELLNHEEPVARSVQRVPAPHAATRRRLLRRLLASAGALTALVAPSSGVGAQMLGVPVLQNAFANPGVTLAANIGFIPNGDAAYGVAAAWSPRSGRFQLSAGAGAYDSDSVSGRATYGGRIAVPALQLAGGAIGVAAFAGVGGGAFSGRTITTVPAGLAIGWRRAFGESRGFSVFATPTYLWTRDATPDRTTQQGLVRLGAGVDIGLARAIGATIGVEAGARARDGEAGPRGVRYGIGLSYAPGRRRAESITDNLNLR